MVSEKKGILVTVAVVFLFGFSVTGCAKKPAEPGPMAGPAATAPAPEPAPVKDYTPEPTPEPAPAPAPAPEPAPAPAPVAAFDVSDLIDVLFAYDKSDLAPESRDKLASNARLLKAASGVKIVIEGHCDERGTNEYNLGLGERRSSAVKNYLVSLGVSASRIKTISYGEEKPFAAGHSEAAWKQNRRAHFGLQ